MRRGNTKRHRDEKINAREFCRPSSTVEQWFCKPPVPGSSPGVGSVDTHVYRHRNGRAYRSVTLRTSVGAPGGPPGADV